MENYRQRVREERTRVIIRFTTRVYVERAYTGPIKSFWIRLGVEVPIQTN